MAQDSVGAIPFFPGTDNRRNSATTSARDQSTESLLSLGNSDSTTSSGTGAGSTTSSGTSGSSPFSMALSKASDDPSDARNNTGNGANSSSASGSSRQGVLHRVDRPKQGNHEPFFPRKAMPYHPEPSESRNDMNPMAAQAAVARQPSRAPSPDEIQSIHDELGDADEGLTPVEGFRGSYSARPTGGLLPDDQQGVMNESYDGMAVSYPVSRIAGESLDDETKASLKAQGLWNQPTMVMAQPSAKLAKMSLTAQQAGMQADGAAGVQVAKPIARFMASLENELGVSPDRLVQAFQQLPPGQLQRPPEETMIQVVKSLGLAKQDEAKALNLYSKMLAQMQMLDGTERMQNASLIGGGLTAGKLGGEIAKQIEGSMQVKPEAKNVAGKYAMQAPGMDSGIPDAVKMKAVQGKDHGMAEMNSAAMNASENALGKDQADSLANQYGMKHIDLKAGMTPAADVAQNMNGQNPQQDLSQQFGANAQAQMQSQQALHKGSPPEAKIADQVKFDLKHDLAADVNVNGDSLKDASQVNLQGQQQNDLKPLAMGHAMGTAASGEMKLDANARHEAIQSIMNHTQSLAQKGGGEMKLTLRPDHLGEIQLKVAMDGNRVNVQMTTEKGEVKKLIEQGVHELRHGLAQHNLSMEKLDVSIANKDAGQFGRGQPDFNQAREFAQQQFSQQHDRKEILDGFSAMKGTAPKMGSNLADKAQASSLFQRSRGSGRLNLVA